MPERLAIFLGGAAGALGRAALAESWTAGAFPWATLLANVLGCLLLGAVLVLTVEGSARHGALGAGLCGGLTTFSALQLELVELLRDGRLGLAAAYAGLSLALGLLSFRLGRVLGDRMHPHGAVDRPTRGPGR